MLTRLEQVLGAFDDLVERDAEPQEVLKAVAKLLGRGVGVCTADGLRITASPDGALRHEAGPVPRDARRLPDGLRVWLEGDPRPEEELLLRRLGVTMKVALSQMDRILLPATEVLFDQRRSEDARLRAAGELGLPEAALLTVLGAKGPGEGVQELISRVRSIASAVHTRVDGNVLILVALGMKEVVSDLAVPLGVRTSLALDVPVLQLPATQELLRHGLRYALPPTHDSAPYQKGEAVLLEVSGLGGYALLPACLTSEQINTVADVQVLDGLRAAHGPEMLRILEAVAAMESVRKAARSVYLHHNSVVHRIERAEQALGFSVTEPYGRNRLFLALCLRRIRESAD